MLTIITNGENRRSRVLLVIILTLFCISITSSLLKIMIFIYSCQDFSVNFGKKSEVFVIAGKSPGKSANRRISRLYAKVLYNAFL